MASAGASAGPSGVPALQQPVPISTLGGQIISTGCYIAAFGTSFLGGLLRGIFSTESSQPRRPHRTSLPGEKQADIHPSASEKHVQAIPQQPLSAPQMQPTFQPTSGNNASPVFSLALNAGWYWIRSRLSLWRDKIKAFIDSLSMRRDGVWEYAVITVAYWGLTITDGAIRMLVLFQFYLMGYSTIQIASLFLLYEIFGVITNLVGGWIGANMGLRVTLFGGLAIQVAALVMLAFMSPAWPTGIVVAYVMVSQALSGIAKDLTKMSSKSAIKAIIPKDADAMLYRWVSLLTGSKNALKGVGFFVGALLLTLTGFTPSLLIMAVCLFFLLTALWRHLPRELGRMKDKASFSSMFSMDRRVNLLSAARFFLFGARDVWFVVALPVFLSAIFGWSPLAVGGYLALWTIGYGIVQSIAPGFIAAKAGEAPKGYTVFFWASVLTAVPVVIALAIGAGFFPGISIVGGLAIFGVIFAINSAVHSYMIVHYAESEKVAMTIGFYYMANAGGRLVGTVLSGGIYQVAGIPGCLWISALFTGISALISTGLVLPHQERVAIHPGLLPARSMLPAAV